MKITVQGVTHEFDLEDFTNVEAMAIERALSMSFGDFGQALANGSASALTGLVWVIQKRDNPSLRFGDVSFTFGELKIEQDEAGDGVDPTAQPATPEASPTDD